jgi:hypothetical protein
MTKNRDEIIIAYRMMPSIYNEDSVLAWMNKVTSLRTKYELIEFYLYKKNYAVADVLLASLPTEYRMDEHENEEYSAYTSLYNFKRNLLDENLEINQLDATKIAQLKEIGDLNNPSFPRSMARSALCFFYKICYPDLIRNLPESTLNKKMPIVQNEISSKEISVYPNPAKDYVVYYYNLSNLNTVSELLVADMTGKNVYTTKINGSQGQHIWDTKSVSSGNYIYTITTQSGEKYTGKVNIAK